MTLTVQIEMEPVRGQYDNRAHWNELFDQVTKRLPGVLQFDHGKVELQVVRVIPKIHKKRKANDPSP